MKGGSLSALTERIHMLPEITVTELTEKLNSDDQFILLDVREPREAEIARIEGSQLVPLRELPKALRIASPSSHRS